MPARAPRSGRCPRREYQGRNVASLRERHSSAWSCRDNAHARFARFRPARHARSRLSRDASAWQKAAFPIVVRVLFAKIDHLFPATSGRRAHLVRCCHGKVPA